MRLLISTAYKLDLTYAKFTITYQMIDPSGIPITYTIGQALSMESTCGEMVVSYELLCEIIDLVVKAAELYDDNAMDFVEIRVYYCKEGESLVGKKIKPMDDENLICSIINKIVNVGLVHCPHPLHTPFPKSISHQKGRRYYSSIITPFKERSEKEQ
jgi:hypothetical protein